MTSIKINNSHSLNLEKLIDSRLLIQANSGGGKSWAIRRLIEQSFGKVQIIVLDPEGEFTNLREKYDFVLAGKDGDAPAESRSAAMLAHRLLELKASAIVDLYELPPHERKHFVKLFIESMVNAPKELWHDCLVIIDEAHVFAPEKGESEAMGPVIDLATRGRKRGYCVVLATQRLSKLHKDAAAECNNKLIGRASQDIDRKRAAEELGFTTKEQIISLRNLRPGEFYVFGPAISDDVIELTVGDLHVKPAPRGQSKHITPPPTDKIKKILGRLADLPAEAKKEAQSLSDLKAEIKDLHRQLSVIKNLPGARTVKIEKVEVPVIGKRSLDKLKISESSLRKLLKAVKEGLSIYENGIEKFSKDLQKAIELTFAAKSLPVEPIAPDKWQHLSTVKPSPEGTNEISSITGPEQKILDAIAWMEAISIQNPERPAIAFLAGYSNTRSTGFTNPCGVLRSKGLITYPSSAVIALTEQGRALANVPDTIPTTEALQHIVLDKLPGPEKKLLTVLLEKYPEAIANPDLAAAVGYLNDKSTGYTNPRGRLRTLVLVEYPNAGWVKAKPLLFL